MQDVLEDERVVVDKTSKEHEVVHLACGQCMSNRADMQAVCGHDLSKDPKLNLDPNREVCIVCRDDTLGFQFYLRHGQHKYYEL